MSEVFVADMAVITALGDSLAATWPRLCAGESATREVTRFDHARLPFHHAACVADLDSGPEENLTCALMRRALGQLTPLPRETFIIWAGVKGNAQSIEQAQDGRKTTDIYLPHHYRRWVGESMHTEGTGFEVNAACASSAVALALGAAMIDQGEASCVLVCAADAVTRFTFTGFAALRGLTPVVCRPFDVARDGLCLGDGAGAMVLMSDAMLRQTGALPLARLAGWGIANDATHITAPARDGCGLIAAIRAALARAGMESAHLDGFCAHGTGTVYNDAMELTAMDAIFGARALPVFSIKGAIGHTLGPAGVIEAAISIQALREGMVPATAGLDQPEPRAAGRVSPHVQACTGRHILTTNSGFGGVNAALIFSALESPQKVSA